MANCYTKLTVSPAIPSDLLCGLEGHLLMADLNSSHNTYERTVYFYTEEGPTGQVEVDDDLIALVEAAPPGPIADPLKALDLENMLGEDLVLDEHGIDFVDLLSVLVVAHPDKLPKIEVEGCFTGDRSRPGSHGGFAHIITPTGVRSIDTSSFLLGHIAVPEEVA